MARQQENQREKSGTLFILAAALLWGTTGTAQGLAPAGVNPVALGALRVLVGGGALLLIALFRRSFCGVSSWPLLPTAVSALFIAAYQLSFFAAVSLTGVAVGTMVAIGSSPVAAGLLGYLVRGERLGFKWVMATLLAVAGCTLLVSGGGSLLADPKGIALALGAGFSYAAYTVSIKGLLDKNGPDAVLAVVFCVAALLMSPLLLIFDTGWVLTVRGAAVALHLGLFATAGSYWLFVRGLRTVKIGTAATLSLGEPLTASLLGAAGDTVKIGFLGALTGDVAMFGKPTLEGMKMAAEEINAAGGVLGKKIEIVEADNRGDKQEGASVTQKLISRDNVVAIVGDPTTGITKVAAPIAQKAGVVLLSAGATGPGVVETGDFIFRDTLLDSVAIPACIDYFAKDLGYKKVAVITSDNNDYSVGLSQTFRDAAKSKGIEIVADEKIKDGDKDFSAQITNIKAKKPSVIFYSGYYTEAALIMKEARKQGLKVVMFGGDGLFSPKLVELGGDAVEGTMSALGFSPEQASPVTAKFVEAFKKKFNGAEPGLFDAQGYDAILLLVDAMKRANSVDPKAFKDTLAQTKKFEGVSGTISMLPNREPIKSPLALLEVKGGKFVLKNKVPVKMD